MHIAIITEYNPFHMGHEYQIAEIKKVFPDACITAIMGGIFSQRGEPYITTPYVRAEAAVMCGADLVLELPFPFSCAPARIFARAGVEIAAKVGADMLAFGSECGNTESLSATLSHLESSEMKAAVQEYDDGSISKMRAYSLAYKKLFGVESPNMPNDILGIEYLRAIKHGNHSLKPYTVKRMGDFKSGEGKFSSATSIRKALSEHGLAALKGNVPASAEHIYKDAYKNGLFGSDIERLASAILLSLHSAQETTAFSGGGLLSHIKKASANAGSVKELIANAATKRYTDSEISRCILFSLLNVLPSDTDSEIYYTKVLAANKKGCEILKSVHGIEIITKPSACEKLSERAKAQYEAGHKAERAFSLCLNGKYEYMKQTPIIK